MLKSGGTDAAKPEKMAEKVLSCVRSEQRLTGGFMEQGNGVHLCKMLFRWLVMIAVFGADLCACGLS